MKIQALSKINTQFWVVNVTLYKKWGKSNMDWEQYTKMDSCQNLKKK